MQPGLISDFNIKIKHLPTSQMIAFKGWVTDFSDDFSSTWNPVEVYGRMDPLSTFQGTQRQINLSFSVVAGSRAEAIRNNQNVNKLIQFLYPVYDQGSSGKGVSCTNPKDQAIVAAAPLLRLQYANLAQNNTDQQGLVGYLQGVNYAPNIDAGQFLPTDIVSSNPDVAPVRLTQGSPTAEMVYQDEIDMLRKEWNIPFKSPGDGTFVYERLIIKKPRKRKKQDEKIITKKVIID